MSGLTSPAIDAVRLEFARQIVVAVRCTGACRAENLEVVPLNATTRVACADIGGATVTAPIELPASAWTAEFCASLLKAFDATAKIVLRQIHHKPRAAL